MSTLDLAVERLPISVTNDNVKWVHLCDSSCHSRTGRKFPVNIIVCDFLHQAKVMRYLCLR